MEYRKAENIGFCFGVKRAVDMSRDLAKTYGRVYTFGELIHNTEVTERLNNEGIYTINSLDEVNRGDCILIRAHGVPASVFADAERRGLIVYDATCPFVKKIHCIVSEQCLLRRIIIIGTKNHPETIGIAGNCKDAFIAENESDIERIDFSGAVCVVAQTTFMHEKFLMLADMLKERFSDIVVFDTTCNTTKKRQEEADDLSRECDTMLVFGSSHSSNTRKLAEICKNNCKNVICIEKCTGYSLNNDNLIGTVGVVGGASTPESMIDEVLLSGNSLGNRD